MKQNRRGEGQAPDPRTIGRAALLCWHDRYNDEKIARSLGISRRTLARWKHRPEFVAAREAVMPQWRLEHGSAFSLSELAKGRR